MTDIADRPDTDAGVVELTATDADHGGSGERYAVLADGHTVCFETFGDPAHPAVLMVMGLGAQMVHWRPELCRRIAERGMFVVRFDNRDIGRSSHYPDGPAPRIIPIVLGRRASAPYRLSNFAADAVGLLDHLGIGRAHLVGASLGGAIVQTIALEHPHRVHTLTSIMAPTGATLAELPRWRLILPMLRPRADDADPVTAAVEFNRMIASPAHPFDAATDRALTEQAYARGYDPEGVERQLAALLASGSRRRALRRVAAPTLVIHGADDPLVPVRAARAIGRAVPRSRVEIIEGMGHDAPPALWDQLVHLVSDHIDTHAWRHA